MVTLAYKNLIATAILSIVVALTGCQQQGDDEQNDVDLSETIITGRQVVQSGTQPTGSQTPFSGVPSWLPGQGSANQTDNSTGLELGFSPVPAVVNLSNAGDYSLSGTCPIEDAIVSVGVTDSSDHQVAFEATCQADGRFATTIDLAALTDGALTIELRNFVDNGDVESTSLTKDTVAPTVGRYRRRPCGSQ